jgi:signal transduction histidine kinase
MRGCVRAGCAPRSSCPPPSTPSRSGSAASTSAPPTRLEASFTSLHRFTADAAHELRAPLSLRRTEIEVAILWSSECTDIRVS